MVNEQARDERLERWKHCSYLGHASMALSQMLGIQKAPTTTDQSRELAGEIAILLESLRLSLANRRGQTMDGEPFLNIEAYKYTCISAANDMERIAGNPALSPLQQQLARQARNLIASLHDTFSGATKNG